VDAGDLFCQWTTSSRMRYSDEYTSSSSDWRFLSLT
jgi:hypothetical protein